MSFVANVRAGKVRTPLQRGFETAQWDNAFKSMSNDSDADRDLYEAGLWFHLQFEGLRKALAAIPPLPMSEENSKRAYIAMLNRDWLIVSRHRNDDKKSSEGPVEADKMIDARMTVDQLPLTRQFPARKSELIEGAVDGARFFLGSRVNVTNTTPSDVLAVLDDVNRHAYVSSMHNWLHNLWNECLWNDWAVEESAEIVALMPRRTDRELAWELARYRQKKLWLEQSARGLQMRGQKPHLAKKFAASVAVVDRIVGSGTSRKYTTRPATIDDFESLNSLLALGALDPYIDSLLQVPLPIDRRLTLNVLLNAWRLMESIAVQFEERMPSDTTVRSLGKLYQYAPAIHRSALEEVLGRATKLPSKTVTLIIELLTFGDHKYDLWLRPLVPIGENLIPVIAVLRVSNPMRLLEGWLKEANFDLASRGDLFEEYCRAEARDRLSNSPLAGIGKVVSGSVSVGVGQHAEQIDLVCQIGSRIIIGECKCSLFPVSANERHNVLSTFEDAAAQAKRKAAFCVAHPEAFREATGLSYEGKEFVPLVISSTSAYVGYTIDDVPITDMRILARFFDGVWEVSHIDLAGTKKDVLGRQTRLYKRPSQADASLIDYLKRPPQIFAAEAALDARPRDLPVPAGNKQTVVIDLQVVGDAVNANKK